MHCQHPSVRSGVGNEQDHDIDATVPPLEGASPIHGLRIPDARLGLDADPDVVDPDQSVPRPLVARNRQRHLRGHGHAWRQPPAEPLEQCELPRVQRRVTARSCPHDQPKPHGGTATAQLIDGQVREGSSFDPPELSVRHADARRRRSKARAGGYASVTDLVAHLEAHAPGEGIRFLPLRRSPSHCSIMPGGASRSLSPHWNVWRSIRSDQGPVPARARVDWIVRRPSSRRNRTDRRCDSPRFARWNAGRSAGARNTPATAAPASGRGPWPGASAAKDQNSVTPVKVQPSMRRAGTTAAPRKPRTVLRSTETALTPASASR